MFVDCFDLDSESNEKLSRRFDNLLVAAMGGPSSARFNLTKEKEKKGKKRKK